MIVALVNSSYTVHVSNTILLADGTINHDTVTGNKDQVSGLITGNYSPFSREKAQLIYNFVLYHLLKLSAIQTTFIVC